VTEFGLVERVAEEWMSKSRVHPRDSPEEPAHPGREGPAHLVRVWRERAEGGGVLTCGAGLNVRRAGFIRGIRRGNRLIPGVRDRLILGGCGENARRVAEF
jgi:hypothetical protein